RPLPGVERPDAGRPDRLRHPDRVARRDRASLWRRQPADHRRRHRPDREVAAVTAATVPERVDLVVAGARCVATQDADRRELDDGWVAIDGGLIAAVGSGAPPAADSTIDASGCLVTPGLINGHHHM